MITDSRKLALARELAEITSGIVDGKAVDLWDRKLEQLAESLHVDADTLADEIRTLLEKI